MSMLNDNSPEVKAVRRRITSAIAKRMSMFVSDEHIKAQIEITDEMFNLRNRQERLWQAILDSLFKNP